MPHLFHLPHPFWWGGSLFVCLSIVQILFATSSMATKKGVDMLAAECIEIDKEFMEIPLCKVQELKNEANVLNIIAHLHKKMETASIRLQLFRKVGKIYKPFIYDNLVDVCTFLGGFGQQRQTFWGLIYPMVTKFSNINHTCPYEPHDIVVKDLIANNDLTNMVPLPKGRYRVRGTLFLNNAKRVIVTVDGEKS